MKFTDDGALGEYKTSLSARRVWIEIYADIYELVDKESLSARRVWIEISSWSKISSNTSSLSARRVWIEIRWGRSRIRIRYLVTLREEGVD